MRFIYRNHCMSCVPAHLGAGLSRGRKVELPHSQGMGQAWGWVGTCSCDGPYSCIIHYSAIKYAQRYQEALLNWTDARLRVGQLWRLLFLGEESGASALSGDWLGGRAGRCVHARVPVNIMHNNLIQVDLWNLSASVNFEPVHDRTPACLCAGPSWGRKVEPPHSWGLGRCGGWRGPMHVPVNNHPIQLAIQYQQYQQCQ